MTARRGPDRRRRAVPLVLTACLVLAACGVEPETPLPTAVAVSIDDSASGPPDVEATPAPKPTASATPTAAPSDGPSERPTEQPTDGVAGSVRPSPVDIATFVAGHRIEGAVAVEHVAVDLDGDGESEVVLTGLVGDVAVLEVAWWTGSGFEVLATGRGGRGRSISSLRVTDVNRDSFMEVLIEVESAGGASLSLWGVRARGRLVPLSAIGGCHDGSHVYGVVGVRLVAAGAGRPPTIVATCDDSPLPMADWSEDRWEWTLGAYRVVKPTPVPKPEPKPQPEPQPEPTPSPTATPSPAQTPAPGEGGGGGQAAQGP